MVEAVGEVVVVAVVVALEKVGLVVGEVEQAQVNQANHTSLSCHSLPTTTTTECDTTIVSGMTATQKMTSAMLRARSIKEL